jgi:hypothetical protein
LQSLGQKERDQRGGGQHGADDEQVAPDAGRRVAQVGAEIDGADSFPGELDLLEELELVPDHDQAGAVVQHRWRGEISLDTGALIAREGPALPVINTGAHDARLGAQRLQGLFDPPGLVQFQPDRAVGSGHFRQDGDILQDPLARSDLLAGGEGQARHHKSDATREHGDEHQLASDRQISEKALHATSLPGLPRPAGDCLGQCVVFPAAGRRFRNQVVHYSYIGRRASGLRLRVSTFTWKCRVAEE